MVTACHFDPLLEPSDLEIGGLHPGLGDERVVDVVARAVDLAVSPPVRWLCLGAEWLVGESVVGGAEADLGVALDHVRELGSTRLVPLRSAVEVTDYGESPSLSLEVVQLGSGERLRAVGDGRKLRGAAGRKVRGVVAG